MSNIKLMNQLRELWKQKDYKGFQRCYSLGNWMLTPEDRDKINKALEKLGGTPCYPKQIDGKQENLLDLALKEMGGEVIK